MAGKYNGMSRGRGGRSNARSNRGSPLTTQYSDPTTGEHITLYDSRGGGLYTKKDLLKMVDEGVFDEYGFGYKQDSDYSYDSNWLRVQREETKNNLKDAIKNNKFELTATTRGEGNYWLFMNITQ